jgi:hypothetical protein
MSTTVAGAEVRAHPRRYRRSFSIIPVCGFGTFALQPLHSANSVLKGTIVYFDAHRIFRNFSVLAVLAVFPLNLLALAPTFSQRLVPSEFE